MSEVSMPPFAESWGQAVGKMGFTGSQEDVSKWARLTEEEREDLRQAMIEQIETLIPSLAGRLDDTSGYRLSAVLDAIAGLNLDDRKSTPLKVDDDDYPENNVQIGES